MRRFGPAPLVATSTRSRAGSGWVSRSSIAAESSRIAEKYRRRRDCGVSLRTNAATRSRSSAVMARTAIARPSGMAMVTGSRHGPRDTAEAPVFMCAVPSGRAAGSPSGIARSAWQASKNGFAFVASVTL